MLIENTLFLRKNFPEIRQYYIDNDRSLDLTNIEVLQSRTEVPTIRYKTDENKQLMVHSSYDPIKEAARVISAHEGEIGPDTHVLFYGIGLGYHIEEFIKTFPDLTYSLYEPSPEIFLTMSQNKKLESFITKNLKQLYLDLPEEQDFNYTQEFLEENRNIHMIIHPGYENILIDKKQQFLNNIKETVRNRRMSVYTNASFQKLWIINSIINFNKVLHTPNILKDIDCNQFKGKPAIIISAGPSLAEDIEHIRYIKDNNLAYLFSVGSAINSLISYDILPDAVFTYDPGLINYKVFEKMNEKGIESIPMVFGSSVGHDTLTKYKGPKVHFITSQDRTSLYYLDNQLILEEDLILDSPSIAVMTFQILNKLDVGPIIFAGQNLGYLYGRTYSKGIEYDYTTSIVDEENLKNALSTMDVYGNLIKTSVGFNKMRESIEGFAKKYKENIFINSTKGGAKIEGVPFKPIEDVINEILNKPIKKYDWWIKENGYDKGLLKERYSSLLLSIKEYHDIQKRFEILLVDIQRETKFKNKAQLEQSFVKFDQLYNCLENNVYFTNFLVFYIRVHFTYVQNAMKNINQRELYTRGDVISTSFNNFISQCKKASLELEKIIFEMDIN